MAVLSEKSNIFKIITEPRKQFERLRRKPGLLIPILIILLIGIINITLALLINPDVSDDMSQSGTSYTITIIFSALMGFFTILMVLILRAVLLMIIMMFVEPGEDIQYPITIAIYTYIVVQIGELVSTIIAFLVNGNPQKDHTSLGLLYARDMSTSEFINDVTYIFLASINPFQLWMLILVFIGIKVLYKTTTVKAVIATILFYILPLIGSMFLGSLL